MSIRTDFHVLTVLELEARPEVFVLGAGEGNLQIVHYYIIEKWDCIYIFYLVSSQEEDKVKGIVGGLLAFGFVLWV